MKTDSLASQYLETHYPEPEPQGPSLLEITLKKINQLHSTVTAQYNNHYQS